MKKYCTLLCLFIVIMTTSVHAQMNNREFLQGKVQRFSKMKNTGIIMTAVGAASTIGGVISLSGTHWESTDDGYETHDTDALVGMIFTGIGVGLMAGGITCIAIGDKKSKKYQKALKELTIIPLVEPNKTGVMLTFRF